jgi:hypothetical protein
LIRFPPSGGGDQRDSSEEFAHPKPSEESINLGNPYDQNFGESDGGGGPGGKARKEGYGVYDS